MRLWINELGPWEVERATGGIVARYDGEEIRARNNDSLRLKLLVWAERQEGRKRRPREVAVEAMA